MGIKKMLFRENEALRHEVALLKEELCVPSAATFQKEFNLASCNSAMVIPKLPEMSISNPIAEQLSRIADAMDLKVGNDGSVMEDFVNIAAKIIDNADPEADADEVAGMILSNLHAERLIIRRRL